MKLNATLSFTRDEVEEAIKTQVQQSGYMLDSVQWTEDGGAEASVRPMTAEERAQHGLPSQRPEEYVAESLREDMKQLLVQELAAQRRELADDVAEHIAAAMYALKPEIDLGPLQTLVEQALDVNPVHSSEPVTPLQPLTVPVEPGTAQIAAFEEADQPDVGLLSQVDESEDPDADTRQARLNRVRREINAAGFVRKTALDGHSEKFPDDLRIK